MMFGSLLLVLFLLHAQFYPSHASSEDSSVTRLFRAKTYSVVIRKKVDRHTLLPVRSLDFSLAH